MAGLGPYNNFAFCEKSRNSSIVLCNLHFYASLHSRMRNLFHEFPCRVHIAAQEMLLMLLLLC